MKNKLFTSLGLSLLTSFAFASEFTYKLTDNAPGHPAADVTAPLYFYNNFVPFTHRSQNGNQVTSSVTLPNVTGDITVASNEDFQSVMGYYSPIGTAQIQAGKIYTVNGEYVDMQLFPFYMYNENQGSIKEKFYNHNHLVGWFSMEVDFSTKTEKIKTIAGGQSNDCVIVPMQNGNTYPYCNFPQGINRVDVVMNNNRLDNR